MSAPLSIIIPTLNAERSLLRLLPQLVDGLTTGLIAELIFADGGSTDQTEAIAEEAGAIFITSQKGRGTQLRSGATAAEGQWLLFLHADSQMPPNWTQIIDDHISNHPQKAGTFSLNFDDTAPMAKITAAWANLRTRLFGLPYGDQGLLLTASLYTKIGGYDPIPLMEDVAIAKKLRGHLRPLLAQITTSADKYKRDGWLKRGGQNLMTLALFKFGRSPEVLAERYNRANHKSS
jgi:rSAM/selenodomain-associated transferase 2